jgi:hypothetical protein
LAGCATAGGGTRAALSISGSRLPGATPFPDYVPALFGPRHGGLNMFAWPSPAFDERSVSPWR